MKIHGVSVSNVIKVQFIGFVAKSGKEQTEEKANEGDLLNSTTQSFSKNLKKMEHSLVYLYYSVFLFSINKLS